MKKLKKKSDVAKLKAIIPGKRPPIKLSFSVRLTTKAFDDAVNRLKRSVDVLNKAYKEAVEAAKRVQIKPGDLVLKNNEPIGHVVFADQDYSGSPTLKITTSFAYVKSRKSIVDGAGVLIVDDPIDPLSTECQHRAKKFIDKVLKHRKKDH